MYGLIAAHLISDLGAGPGDENACTYISGKCGVPCELAPHIALGFQKQLEREDWQDERSGTVCVLLRVGHAQICFMIFLV